MSARERSTRPASSHGAPGTPSRTSRCSSASATQRARRAAHALSDQDGRAAAGALDGAARARLGERGGMAEVAELLELTPAYVKGVVTFYTMYHQHPVGKHFIQVCTTSPCNVCGAEEVVDAFLAAHRLRELGADVARRQVHGDRSRVPRRLRLRDAGDDQRGVHRDRDAGAGARAFSQDSQLMGYPHQAITKRDRRPLQVLRRRRGAHARRLEQARRLQGAGEGARHGAGRHRRTIVKESGLRGRGGAGFPDGHEVVVHEAGRRQAALSLLQRRRVRAGHVQGSRDHALDAARPGRGLRDRRVRDRRRDAATSTSAASSPSRSARR